MLNYAGTPPLAAMAETGSCVLAAAELRALIARIEIGVRRIDAAMEPEDDSAISGSNENYRAQRRHAPLRHRGRGPQRLPGGTWQCPAAGHVGIWQSRMRSNRVAHLPQPIA